MEQFIGVLIFALLIFLIQVILLRWIFRINDIVNKLEKISNSLEAIKEPNSVLIKQQDEVIILLEDELDSHH